jgi:hypothetical protein
MQHQIKHGVQIWFVKIEITPPTDKTKKPQRNNLDFLNTDEQKHPVEDEEHSSTKPPTTTMLLYSFNELTPFCQNTAESTCYYIKKT